MLGKFEKVLLFLSLLIWPLSLFLANTPNNFLFYILPAILVTVSYFLAFKKSSWYPVPLLLIPFIQPKLALFPLIIFILEFVVSKTKNPRQIFLLLAATIILILNFKAFWGQTIFKKDYEAEQAVIRQTQLYPNVLLARISHNKLRIYFDKFNNNFFALTDPNNYFFRFHPRQITVDNQNLKKFSALAIIPILYSLLNLTKVKNKYYILLSLGVGILSLSVLSNFDRNDIILWLPFSLLFIEGFKLLSKNYKKYFPVFSVILFGFSILEVIQIIVQN